MVILRFPVCLDTCLSSSRNVSTCWRDLLPPSLGRKRESHGKAIVRYGQEKEYDSASEPMRDGSIRREGAKTMKERQERITCWRGKRGILVIYVAKFLLFTNSQIIVLFLQITCWRLCRNLKLLPRIQSKWLC